MNTLVAIDMKKLEGHSTKITGILRALSNANRLLILARLVDSEACVSELEEALEIHQPTLSQQLGVLRSESLVLTRRDGKNIFYRIADDSTIIFLKALCE